MVRIAKEDEACGLTDRGVQLLDKLKVRCVAAFARAVRIQRFIRGAVVPAHLSGADEDGLRFHIREQRPQRGVSMAVDRTSGNSTRESSVYAAWSRVVKILHIYGPRAAHLSQIRYAVRLASGLSCTVKHGKEQRSKERDDRDNDEEFDKGKATARPYLPRT
jgi:hypothetical protein